MLTLTENTFFQTVAVSSSLPFYLFFLASLLSLYLSVSSSISLFLCLFTLTKGRSFTVLSTRVLLQTPRRTGSHPTDIMHHASSLTVHSPFSWYNCCVFVIASRLGCLHRLALAEESYDFWAHLTPWFGRSHRKEDSKKKDDHFFLTRRTW